MVDFFKKIFLKEQFYPSFLGILINPFYFARLGLVTAIQSMSASIKGKTLDIGCGQKPYKMLFASTEYIGLEIDTVENRKNKHADFYYDGKIFPFNKNEFDSVVMFQVFEHVFNPDEVLSEVNRVLKPGGNILLTVPFVWDEHEQPYDFARYSSYGLKAILIKHGFEVVEQHKSLDDIRVIFQLINAYIYKTTVSSNKYINMLLMVVLMSPFNIVGQLLFLILPQNKDLYLDNIVLAKRS